VNQELGLDQLWETFTFNPKTKGKKSLPAQKNAQNEWAFKEND
jgi:hypothetical protein